VTSTITVLRGLPGSGKTTWAREYARAHRGEVGIVCRDTIREYVLGLTMQAGDSVLDRCGEDLVTALCRALAAVLLESGRDVIVDATNLSPVHVDVWRALASGYGAAVEILDMDVPVEECTRRDAARAAAGGRSVGADVIRRMAAKSRPGEEVTGP
jgi:predicted kinase